MKNSYSIFKKNLAQTLRPLLFAALMLPAFITNLSAQVVINHPTANGAASDYTTNWTVPANVTAVTLEAWGGGAGASLWNNATFDKGGQGGSYSKVVNYPVTQGDVLNISVGAGGQAGSYCGGNTVVSKGGNLLLRALGGAFFFVNCVCYEHYVYPGTNCTSDTAINQVDAGEATNTTAGGHAGGMAYGGGSGGVYPGGNGTVPGGGAATGTGTRLGASGRVKISYVLTGMASTTPAVPFHIYPNPAEGIFHVSMKTQSTTPKDIIVYDLLGNTVYENKNVSASEFTIDITSKNKGLYFMKVVSEGKTYLSRLTYM